MTMSSVPPARPHRGPLRVHVLVDLFRGQRAGGHVKTWERFAEAAVGLDRQLDMSLHFLGPAPARVELAPNVRYLIHPPRFSTERLPFLRGLADYTDLAGWHPGLARSLAGAQVLHATHPSFAFGRTAATVAGRRSLPLACSVHTDVPKYTEAFTAQLITRLLGEGALAGFMNARLRLPQRRGAAMARQLRRYWARCDRVFVSQQDDFDRVRAALPASRIAWLRRGIDARRFAPTLRDRARLSERFGVPADRPLLLYVGRVDAAKDVMTLGHAVRRLRAQGTAVHALVVGEGSSRPALARLLGADGSLPGNLPQDELGWIYASADLFVFPSRSETYGNVVVEAKAAGLPVLVSTEGGAAQRVRRPGEDGLRVPGHDGASWAAAIAALLAEPARMARMGHRARAQVENEWPSWGEVLRTDLLPVWQALAAHADSSAVPEGLARQAS